MLAVAVMTVMFVALLAIVLTASGLVAATMLATRTLYMQHFSGLPRAQELAELVIVFQFQISQVFHAFKTGLC